MFSVTYQPYQFIIKISDFCLDNWATIVKNTKVLDNFKSFSLVSILIFSNLFTWYFRYVLGRANLSSYISPTIILNSIILVTLFSRCNFKGHYISRISPHAFGIYLFQLNTIIWETLKNSFSFISNYELFKGFFSLLFYSGCLFLLGLLVEVMRKRVFKILKVDLLCEKILHIGRGLVNITTQHM